ncbi:MAG: tetratricopeptide repeat protein [Phycisphaerales bacterium]|nr:tetratricopeptide repeat protein [Phycisphaerales bacterium]
MTTPDPNTIEQMVERAWQVPPAGREAFVRAQAGGDEALIAAVLERLGGAGSGGHEAPGLDATIDLPAGIDLDATLDLPGNDEVDPGDQESVESAVDSIDTDATIVDEESARAGSFKDVPDQVADFRINEILGSGGMGDVYLAEQLNPHRKVALKVIRSAIATAESLKRFEVEAHTLARLSHPGIAQVYSAGVDSHEGRAIPFFAMEYIADAMELTEWADERALNQVQRLRLFQTVCEAVSHGHQRGVMHLDLKPGNILVNAEGQPKVIDFGVAQMEEKEKGVAHRRQIVGTLQYMPPEQVRGDADMDISCDVYALGVVLYQLLTGELPYEIDTTSIRAATTSVLEARIPSILEIRPDLGLDLDAIIAKALAKSPDDRYRSASELGEDIRRYLEDEPISARKQTTGESVRRFMRRHRAATFSIITVAVVVLVGLIAISIFAYRTEQARSEEHRQRQLADLALERANAERKRLFKITQFQSAMIKNIEPVDMGDGLRKAWISSLEDRLLREGASEEAIDQAIAEQETFLNQFNHTDIAVGLIDNHILRQALKDAPQWFEGEPSLEADLREIVADAYEQIGLYSEAAPEYEHALQIRTDLFGDAHERTLESVSDLGQLRLSQGQFKESRALLETALTGRRALLGKEDPETIGSMQNLGMALYRQGEVEEAEVIWSEALELSRRVNEAEDPVTATLASNLGVLYLEMNRLEDARILLEQDLTNSERLHGPTHPDTLDAKLNLGVLAMKMGDVEGAASLYSETLAGSRKSMGERHPRTLLAMVNLGALRLQQGRMDEAVELLRTAYLVRQEELGDSHPDTFQSLQFLAEAYLVSGDMVTATPYVTTLSAEFVTRYGAADPRSVTWQFRKGLVLFSAERYAKAEVIFLALRKICTESPGLQQDPTCGILPNILFDLYTRWHEQETEAGHDASAERWLKIRDGVGT